MTNVIKKRDIENLIQTFGYKKGDTICLQADLSGFDGIATYQALIEMLQEAVGSEGCILIPSFSFSTLDPAVHGAKDYEFEEWENVREEILGYQAKITLADVYRDLNAQMNKYKVSRSMHPVYSFTYWGNFQQDYLKQSMNFPISFTNALKAFTKGRAYNLIIGDRKENSVLIPAIAQAMGLGVCEVQRAYSMRNRKNVFHTYLNLRLNQKEIEEILEISIIQKSLLCDEQVYNISIQK